MDGDQTRWTAEGEYTIGHSIISMIDVRQSDGFVAVATWGDGMFSGYVRPSASAAPRLIYPPNQSVGIDPRVRLTFSSTGPAADYQVQVSTSATFSPPTTLNASAIDTMLGAIPLNPNTRYYWRVASIAASTDSVWSPTGMFVTGTTSSVRDGATRPAGPWISSPTPNPTDGFASISFGGVQGVPATIDVIDMSGKRRVQLWCDQLTTSREIRFDASKLESGSYELVLRAGSSRVSRRLIIKR